MRIGGVWLELRKRDVEACGGCAKRMVNGEWGAEGGTYQRSADLLLPFDELRTHRSLLTLPSLNAHKCLITETEKGNLT